MVHDDYLDVEEEFEPVEGCNCIYCRMARMEKSMKELESMVNELRVFLETSKENSRPREKSRA